MTSHLPKLISIFFLLICVNYVFADECAVAINPSLNSVGLKGYKLIKDPKSTQGIIESGTMSGGEGVILHSHGCESVSKEYVIKIPKAKCNSQWLKEAGLRFKKIDQPVIATSFSKLKKNPRLPFEIDQFLSLQKADCKATKEGAQMTFGFVLNVFVD